MTDHHEYEGQSKQCERCGEEKPVGHNGLCRECSVEEGLEE